MERIFTLCYSITYLHMFEYTTTCKSSNLKEESRVLNPVHRTKAINSCIVNLIIQPSVCSEEHSLDYLLLGWTFPPSLELCYKVRIQEFKFYFQFPELCLSQPFWFKLIIFKKIDMSLQKQPSSDHCSGGLSWSGYKSKLLNPQQNSHYSLQLSSGHRK